MFKVIVYGGVIIIGTCSIGIIGAIIYSAIFLNEVHEFLLTSGSLILGFLLGSYFNLVKAVVEKTKEDDITN
ncbi:MAG: hypothetical protein D3914_03315 [Candidatus Electrothrix sp. LOE2]|jgi:hypothetical protein|nr:hypothetical protein [Candidatus Electrothrix sp. LOE2]